MKMQKFGVLGISKNPNPDSKNGESQAAAERGGHFYDFTVN